MIKILIFLLFIFKSAPIKAEEIFLNQCEINPCQNGATCIIPLLKKNSKNENDSVLYDYHSIECKCTQNYTGKLCESRIEINKTNLEHKTFLINYWSMSNLNDSVGGANFYDGFSYEFVTDRFNQPDSAIYFKNGYLRVPSGIYFSGDFSMIAYIKLKSYEIWSPILDFGNGQNSDNVVFEMNDIHPQLYSSIFNGDLFTRANTTEKIELDVWYHVAFVLKGSSLHFYINGVLSRKATMFIPRSVIRTNNFIGTNNWDDECDAIYDEIKIYNGSLSTKEIMEDYLNTRNSNATLINYWPMSNLSDVIGDANLFDGVNYTFVSDRFNNSKSAIYFNYGYLKVPPGIYFSHDFSITAYMLFPSFKSWSPFLDFGNGVGSDNVVFEIYNNSSKLYFSIYNEKKFTYINTAEVIKLGVWNHVAFVLEGSIGSFYINGSKVKNATINPPKKLLRSNNFIGKDSWSDSANAIYDEIKFYRGALSEMQIKIDYLSSISNPCKSNPCQNNGTCSNTNDFKEYKCDCITGFNGQNCQIVPNYCESNPCQNEGICTNSVDYQTYKCTCNDGFSGKNCEIFSNPCLSNPCMDNSTCLQSNNSNGYDCLCAQDTANKNCEKLLYACKDKPCKNGGLCQNLFDFKTYKCICLEGFNGQNCESVLNPCQQNPCQNEGVCIQKPSLLYECNCSLGFIGLNCETKLKLNGLWNISNKSFHVFLNHENSSVWYEIRNNTIENTYDLVNESQVLNQIGEKQNFDVVILDRKKPLYLIFSSDRVNYKYSKSKKIYGPLHRGIWVIKFNKNPGTQLLN